MVNEVKFTSIMSVWDRCLQHPLLHDITLEQVIQYVSLFNSLFNMSNLYTTKYEIVDVEEFRAKLPCDLVSIIQVKDCKTGLCIHKMSGTFMNDSDLVYKTQNSILYTNVPECCLEIAYKAIPVDEEGYPMVLDNEKYLNALYEFIKTKMFTTLVETGQMNPNLLGISQQEYAWAAGQLQEELNTPSIAEMEALSNAHNKLIMENNQFEEGFSRYGEHQHLNVH
jgi:hypothetical protein